MSAREIGTDGRTPWLLAGPALLLFVGIVLLVTVAVNLIVGPLTNAALVQIHSPTMLGQTSAMETDLQSSVDAARDALHLSTERYESGYSAYLAVLDAQRTLNISQLALIRNRQALLSASVDLMKALGGGWTDETPFAQR